MRTFQLLVLLILSSNFLHAQTKESELTFNDETILEDYGMIYKNNKSIFPISLKTDPGILDGLINTQTNYMNQNKEYRKLRKIDSLEFQDSVYIKNAGLIILSPFLERLFESTGLTDNNVFNDERSKSKAVHLLDYAAGGKTGSKEYDLVLNKLLCGMSVSDPIEENIHLTNEDIEIVNDLLRATIQQWTAIGETSIDGLRDIFLQRDGKLKEDGEQYYLIVEGKPYDMLLNQIPWNISKIRLNWMKKELLVKWRY